MPESKLTKSDVIGLVGVGILKKLFALKGNGEEEPFSEYVPDIGIWPTDCL